MHGGPHVCVHTVPHSCGANADRTLQRRTPPSGTRGVCRPTSHSPGKTREHLRQGPRGRTPARFALALYSELGQAHGQGRQPGVETRRVSSGWSAVARGGRRLGQMRLLEGPSLPGLAGGFPTRKPLPRKGPLRVGNPTAQVQMLPVCRAGL